MGNCAGAKPQNSKLKTELKEGEQLVTYNGKSYKINVQDIYQKKESETNPYVYQQNCVKQRAKQNSNQIDKRRTRENSMLQVNGKNQDFILQNVLNNSLYVKRLKQSMNHITTAKSLSPINGQNSFRKYRESFTPIQSLQITVV